ncbi:MAG TPA: YCF48-related protein, partial [Blastocatellia bacterium]|nr:YCF48-related protein [Blastocatellia bacterium]
MLQRRIFCVLGLATLFALLFPAPPVSPSARQSATQSNWRQQSSGVLAKLNAVHFIDRQHGWAAGNNGVLLATEDGGEKWSRVALPEYERQEPLLDVWRFDAERGILLGEYDLYDRRPEIEPGKRIFLLRSEDRGRRWQSGELGRPPVKAGNRKTDRDKNDPPEVYPDPLLLRMNFAGNQVGRQVGWAVGELGAIQMTKDGGATWQMQFASAMRIFYDVSAVDEKQAWIAGAGGIVLRTTDGGQSWHEQRYEANQTLRAIHFADADRGWAAGNNGLILATTNGGARWQKQDSGTTQTLHDIFFINPKEGWAAGERGTLLRTTNGGASWQNESLNVRGALTRLFFLAPDCGWVVGANGTIFKYDLTGNA